MCTVSIVPSASSVSVMCNRDERRTRARALAPRVRTAGAREAIYPVDPDSGGTWIAVNDAGVVAAILNRNQCTSRSPSARRASRGTIIPAVIAARTLDEAWRTASEIDGPRFDPFRLVLLHQRRILIVTNEPAVAVDSRDLDAPLLFTSSSLGDRLVERPRRALFEQLVLSGSDLVHGQRRFHRHRWPEHPELSVTMTRADAATVSRTTIEVATGRVAVAYEPVEA